MTDITITVFEKDHDDGIPSIAVDFISFIQAKLADVPDEYRETATLSFYSYAIDYDDGCSSSISIEYTRPMTAEEEEAHAAKERRKAEEIDFIAQWDENLMAAGYSNFEIRSGRNDYYRPDRYPREESKCA